MKKSKKLFEQASSHFEGLASDKSAFGKLSDSELAKLCANVFFARSAYSDLNMNVNSIEAMASRIREITNEKNRELVAFEYLKAALKKRDYSGIDGVMETLKVLDVLGIKFETIQKMYDDAVRENFAVTAAHALGVGGKIKLENNRELDLEGSEWQTSAKQVSKKVPEQYQNVFEDYLNDASKKELVFGAPLQGYERSAKAYKEGKAILLHTSWEGHSATTVLKGNLLMVCNKGAGTTVPGIKVYSIQPKNGQTLADIITPNFLKDMSESERKLDAPLADLTGFGSGFTSLSLLTENLDIEKISEIRTKGQKIGNCTYTNAKRSVHALMMFDQLENIDGFDNKTKSEQEKILQSVFDQTNARYREFTVDDRKEKINQLFAVNNIKSLEDISNNKILNSMLARYFAVRSNKQSAHNLEVSREILSKIRSLASSNDEYKNFLLGFKKEIRKQNKVNAGLIARKLRSFENVIFSVNKRNKPKESVNKKNKSEKPTPLISQAKLIKNELTKLKDPESRIEAATKIDISIDDQKVKLFEKLHQFSINKEAIKAAEKAFNGIGVNNNLGRNLVLKALGIKPGEEEFIKAQGGYLVASGIKNEFGSFKNINSQLKEEHLEIFTKYIDQLKKSKQYLVNMELDEPRKEVRKQILKDIDAEINLMEGHQKELEKLLKLYDPEKSNQKENAPIAPWAQGEKTEAQSPSQITLAQSRPQLHDPEKSNQKENAPITPWAQGEKTEAQIRKAEVQAQSPSQITLAQSRSRPIITLAQSRPQLHDSEKSNQKENASITPWAQGEKTEAQIRKAEVQAQSPSQITLAQSRSRPVTTLFHSNPSTVNEIIQNLGFKNVNEFNDKIKNNPQVIIEINVVRDSKNNIDWDKIKKIAVFLNAKNINMKGSQELNDEMKKVTSRTSMGQNLQAQKNGVAVKMLEQYIGPSESLLSNKKGKPTR